MINWISVHKKMPPIDRKILSFVEVRYPGGMFFNKVVVGNMEIDKMHAFLLDDSNTDYFVPGDESHGKNRFMTHWAEINEPS